MSGKSLLAPFLAVALAGSTLGVPAFAADGFTPRPQRTFTEKPRIEDYADYNAFLVDIMEFRRQKAERAKARAAAGIAGSAEQVSDSMLSGVSGQQQEDISGLYRITAPESLEDALERARKLPHPVYDEPERFGRTTSFSFPIPPMEGDDMGAQEVPGQFNEANGEAFVVYEDETAPGQVATLLSGNPDNSDEARDKKAYEGTNDAYVPSWNPSTRWVTDSDGNRYWVPITIEGEYGVTVIRVFNIEVGIFKN